MFKVIPKVVYRPTFLSEETKVGLILKNFHLRPVKEIKYAFDPYAGNTKSIRKVMFALNSKSVLKTSSARSKIDVRDDRCLPQIDVKFADGHNLIFKTENLNASDIIAKLDEFCKAKDTAQPDADMALAKLSGKPKKR